MHVKTTAQSHPEPRMPIRSAVPPTPAEEGAASVSWERRGLLGRLIRR